MKFPNKLNILGQDYKIIHCKTEKEFLKHRDADKEDMGMCDKMEKEIWLNGAEHARYKNSDIRLRETLLHEIGHALFEEAGLSYGVALALEEIIVDVYSKLITKLPTAVK